MPFRLIAHRGAPLRAPENTLVGFRAARELGASEVETDVQLTRDGVAVLCHDRTLARYGHGGRAVEQCSYRGADGLAGLDFGAWFSPRFTGTAIATLDELLDTHGRDFDFHLELKGADPRLAEHTLAAVESRGLLGRCVLTSLSVSQLRRARAVSGQVRLGLLVPGLGDDECRAAEAVELFQLCPDASSVTADGVQRALRSVSQVRAWGCPREPAAARRTARQLEAAGCVGLTVDDVGWFAEPVSVASSRAD